jgi:hypothetical protein
MRVRTRAGADVDSRFKESVSETLLRSLRSPSYLRSRSSLSSSLRPLIVHIVGVLALSSTAANRESPSPVGSSAIPKAPPVFLSIESWLIKLPLSVNQGAGRASAVLRERLAAQRHRPRLAAFLCIVTFPDSHSLHSPEKLPDRPQPHLRCNRPLATLGPNGREPALLVKE